MADYLFSFASAPNSMVYLSSNEKGLALDPVVYPSSYEEGRTSSLVVSGFS